MFLELFGLDFLAAFERCDVFMEVVLDTLNTKINCSYFPDDKSPDNDQPCISEKTPVVPTASPSKCLQHDSLYNLDLAVLYDYFSGLFLLLMACL